MLTKDGAKKDGFLEHLAGLRGLAIILVVLFHLDAEKWAHGYLGVDVFLVIMGYLMARARLAHPGREGWREMIGYLAKRVRRIVPPMLVVILGSLAAGAVLLWWQDELTLSKLGFAACLGKANMMLKREFDNYFAAESMYMPLLHLWYLSVVLQVCLIYAVGNQLLQRVPGRWRAAALALAGLGSLIFCYGTALTEGLRQLGLWAGEVAAPVSYYETLPRLWEVMAGGLVCLLPGAKSRAVKTALAGAGLLLVLGPALAGTLPGTAWLAKGPSTIAAVAGAVLALRYAPGSRVCPLLSCRALVWLGGISFSLYLVHMPIIVFMRMWVYGQPGAGYSVLMLAVALAAGLGFRHAVEKRRFAWWLVGVLWVAALLLCRAGRRTNGFSAYLPAGQWVMPVYEQWQVCDEPAVRTAFRAEQFTFFEAAFRYMNQLARKPERLQAPLLVMGEPSAAPRCLLIGDSHAAGAYAGLDAALKRENIAGLYLASFVYPLHGWQEDKVPDYTAPAPREQALLDWLTAHPEISHIIIAQRWWYRFDKDEEQSAEALRVFLQELNAAGKRVVLLAPTPEFGQQASLLHYDKILALQGKSGAAADAVAAVCSREQYLSRNARALPILQRMQELGLCTIIHPLEALAPGEVFYTMKDGRLLMNDSNHMNPGMSLWLMEQLSPQLRAALK